MTEANSRIQDKRIKNAIEVITRFGHIDGNHHKQWVLDQATRALFGGKKSGGQFTTTKEYKKHVAEFCDGEDGPNTYEWDVGIAP